MDDPKQLPGYYYRDDGLKVWKAIKEFVTNVVKFFYLSDNDVKNDRELVYIHFTSYTLHLTPCTLLPTCKLLMALSAKLQ